MCKCRNHNNESFSSFLKQMGIAVLIFMVIAGLFFVPNWGDGHFHNNSSSNNNEFTNYKYPVSDECREMVERDQAWKRGETTAGVSYLEFKLAGCD